MYIKLILCICSAYENMNPRPPQKEDTASCLTCPKGTLAEIGILRAVQSSFIVSLAKGIDVNKHGRLSFTPLMLAAMNGNLDIVKILVENGAEVDMEVDSNDSDTAIVFAAKKGHLDIVEYLIENHAKVDRLFTRGLDRFIRLKLNDTRNFQRNKEEDCRTWENIDGASPLFASGTIHELRKDKRVGK